MLNKTPAQRVAVFSQYCNILHYFETFHNAKNETSHNSLQLKNITLCHVPSDYQIQL